MTSITYLDRYKVSLLPHEIKPKVFNVLIENIETNCKVVINDYKPSPILFEETEQINDGMRFIVNVANSWLSDHLDDEGDGFYEDVYNQLYTVMSHDDMDELYYELNCEDE